MNLFDITDKLIMELGVLQFGPPVTHVYNPLVYARKAYDEYLARYGSGTKEIVLLGMNPGPWGMAQSGIPFGEINLVKNWLKIKTDVGTPRVVHPKRPVTGFDCKKSEVSGKRLWGWARQSFGTPKKFFKRFFVANYCPLLFLESGGRNRTPPSLKLSDRKPLMNVCDQALRNTIVHLKPRYVVGVGTFARDRALSALEGMDLVIGGITHPSPANPRANRGWEKVIVKELNNLGIKLDR